MLLRQALAPRARLAWARGARGGFAHRPGARRAPMATAAAVRSVARAAASPMALTRALSAQAPAAAPAAATTAANSARPMEAFVRNTLEVAFAPQHLEVINESHGGPHLESHFKVIIVSNAFEGKPLLQQHRYVMKAVQDDNGVLPFHSLSVVSFTPEQWEAAGAGGGAVPASPKCAGGDGPK